MPDSPPHDAELPAVPPGKCQPSGLACQLSTVPASQLSAAGILLIYIIDRLIGTIQTGGSTADAVVQGQVLVVALLTVIYIFVCFLLVENRLISDLRILRPAFTWLEFGFRVVLLVVLAFLPTFVNDLIPALLKGYVGRTFNLSPGSSTDHVVVFLVLLYLMFLSWDLIVHIGAPDADGAGDQRRESIRQTARTFARTDGTGLGLLIIVEISRIAPIFAAILPLPVFAYYSVRQIGRVGREMLESITADGIGRQMVR